VTVCADANGGDNIIERHAAIAHQIFIVRAKVPAAACKRLAKA
jgi:hypothetical protein